ncbi:hypothetical protein YC2023_058387 [Brassica napus]
MVLRLSGSPMLLPPPPEPPPVTFLLDLASMIAPPDLPVLPDHSGAPDLFSFTLKIAEPPPVSGTTTSSSACLLLVSLGVNFVMPWLPHTAVCRVQFYYILWRKSSFPPLLLGFVLKDTVFVTPLIESELVGMRLLGFGLAFPYLSLRSCYLSMRSIYLRISYRKLGDDFIKTNLGFLASDLVGGLWTKFVAAFHAFYAAACSDSSSLCVFSDFHGFISLSSTLAVYLTSMVALLYLNNSSMVGV